MSKTFSSDDIIINDDVTISAVDPAVGYTWIGFHLSYSDSILDLIKFNLKKKEVNISKFYFWLQNNENMPFPLKLRILYGCMFSALLYSCEAWGDFSSIENMILMKERKALKACLGIKSGMPEDVIYIEINRPDIKAVIKHSQYNFFERFKLLNFDDSVTKQIWERYIAICNREKSKGFIDYYNSLQRNAKGDNINSRKEKLSQSEKTMDIRYKNLTELKYNNTLYNSMTNDKYRKAISRWRLSSHKLYIEIGRYKIPKIDRYERS